MFASKANVDNLFDQRIATTLYPVSLFQDSSFSAKIQHTFSEGEILEVISETRHEHEDDSQNQRFKWFQVRNKEGYAGWVFGDALAVIVPEQRLEAQLKAVHKQKVNFNHGFENAVMWVAALEGHDNFNRNNFLNPLYQETYLVITNKKRHSVFVQCAGSSTQGKNSVRAINLKDISGDQTPEIILMTKSQNVGSPVENRQIQIFSFQAGTLSNVFEERLTLTYGDDQPSPALYKHIEIESPYIRVAYIDYLKCKNSKLPYEPSVNDPQKSRCLEYVTYTYIWNNYQNRFLPVYEESHTLPRAEVKVKSASLLTKPNQNASTTDKVYQNELLRVIQHFERFTKSGTKKVIEQYLYVQKADGRTGYIRANQIKFVDNEHAALLNRYYNNPPLSKMDWRAKAEFVIVN